MPGGYLDSAALVARACDVSAQNASTALGIGICLGEWAGVIRIGGLGNFAARAVADRFVVLMPGRWQSCIRVRHDPFWRNGSHGGSHNNDLGMCSCDDRLADLLCSRWMKCIWCKARA